MNGSHMAVSWCRSVRKHTSTVLEWRHHCSAVYLCAPTPLCRRIREQKNIDVQECCLVHNTAERERPTGQQALLQNNEEPEIVSDARKSLGSHHFLRRAKPGGQQQGGCHSSHHGQAPRQFICYTDLEEVVVNVQMHYQQPC